MRKNNLFDIIVYSPWWRVGTIIGVIYAYIHPMKNLEGYWEENYLLSTDSGSYHIFPVLILLIARYNRLWMFMMTATG